MEELWQNNNRGRTRGFLQWKREKTRAWREHCHEMSPSLQQAHHHPPEGSPFQHYNIIVQAYSPISDYDGNEIEESCDQLQNVIDQTQKKDILLVQGDWNAKVGRDAGKAFVDPSAMMTQMREDSDVWSLPPLTTLCWRTHLVITKHPEDGHGIAQMDNTTTRLITF